GGDLPARVERMAAEYENVGLALDWAAEEAPDLQVVMISKLHWFWVARSTAREAQQRILSALVREQVSPTRKARLHWVAATWFRLTGELDSAMAQIEEAILILERVDDPVLAAQIVDCRGIVRALTGDLAGAEADFSTSV